MKVLTSVCPLLLIATLVLVAGADPIRTKNFDDIDVNMIDEDDPSLEKERSLVLSRFPKEIKAFKKGLMVEDDNGNLVEISLSEEAAIEETEEKTKRDLDNRIFFRLYTKKNPTDYQPLWLNDKENLAASNFNPDRPTRFITHGWMNSANSPACTLVRDAYLENDDLNVIVVDWSKISMRPYVWATRRVIMVGKQVGKMIDFLANNANLDTDMTTLVGHSLGAHVMGLSGYYAKGVINYVIGLDPALPLFAFAGPGARISLHDANHVQIIHTNAGLLGYLDAIGHSDFYPNGGSQQLGCLLDLSGACSHARSYKFFAESINTSRGFYGVSCHSFTEYLSNRCNSKLVAAMGGPLIDFTSAGKYYLSTRSISPFAKGL